MTDRKKEKKKKRKKERKKEKIYRDFNIRSTDRKIEIQTDKNTAVLKDRQIERWTESEG